MNFLKGFDKHINEALTLSEAKPYVKAWEESGGRERYKDWFNGKYRQYLEIAEKSKIQEEVEQILQDNEYHIISYKGNKVVKVSQPKNITSISKILNRIAPDLRPKYDEDKDKQESGKDYLVVISRHPYDIAGMSTDREQPEGKGWNSCMNIRTGMNKHYVMRDVKNGSIVAYLVNRDDTNINKPICRILMKPFDKKDDSGKTLLVADKVYPYDVDVQGFRDTVQQWLSDKQGEIDGDYRLRYDLYNDGTYEVSNNVLRSYLIKKYDSHYTQDNGTIIVVKNQMFGVVDDKGKVIIPLDYTNIRLLTDDVYQVTKGNYDGLINRKNEILVPIEYLDIIKNYGSNTIILKSSRECYRYFADTNTMSKAYATMYLVKDTEDTIVAINGKYGILNKDNEESIPCIYDDIETIGNNLYKVEKDYLWGIISSKNEIVLPIEYTNITSFRYEYAMVQKGMHNGLINDKGEICVPVKFDKLSTDGEYWKGHKGDLIYLIDPRTKTMTEEGFEKFGYEQNDRTRHRKVYRNGKQGLISMKDLSLVLDTKYDDISFIGLYSDMIRVTLNGKNGLIDGMTMKEVIEPKYDMVSQSRSGGYVVTIEKNGKDYLGLYSSKGELIFEPQFLKIKRAYTVDNNDNVYYKVQNGEYLYGIYKGGEEIIPCKYIGIEHKGGKEWICYYDKDLDTEDPNDSLGEEIVIEK
jgi:hypothetical protein